MDVGIRESDHQREPEPSPPPLANAVSADTPAGRVQDRARGCGIVVGAPDARGESAEHRGGHHGGGRIGGAGPDIARDAHAIHRGGDGAPDGAVTAEIVRPTPVDRDVEHLVATHRRADDAWITHLARKLRDDVDIPRAQ